MEEGFKDCTCGRRSIHQGRRLGVSQSSGRESTVFGVKD